MSVSDAGGYQVSYFVKSPSELARANVLCALCHKVAREPVYLEAKSSSSLDDICHHTFCKSCVDVSVCKSPNNASASLSSSAARGDLSASAPVCPECRTSLTGVQLPDLRAANIIQNLQVCCPLRRSKGCKVVSSPAAVFSSPDAWVMEHIRVCPFYASSSGSTIACPFLFSGCKHEAVAVSKLNDHLQSTAEFHLQLVLGKYVELLKNSDPRTADMILMTLSGKFEFPMPTTSSGTRSASGSTSKPPRLATNSNAVDDSKSMAAMSATSPPPPVTLDKSQSEPNRISLDRPNSKEPALPAFSEDDNKEFTNAGSFIGRSSGLLSSGGDLNNDFSLGAAGGERLRVGSLGSRSRRNTGDNGKRSIGTEKPPAKPIPTAPSPNRAEADLSESVIHGSLPRRSSSMRNVLRDDTFSPPDSQPSALTQPPSRLKEVVNATTGGAKRAVSGISQALKSSTSGDTGAPAAASSGQSSSLGGTQAIPVIQLSKTKTSMEKVEAPAVKRALVVNNDQQ